MDWFNSLLFFVLIVLILALAYRCDIQHDTRDSIAGCNRVYDSSMSSQDQLQAYELCVNSVNRSNEW